MGVARRRNMPLESIRVEITLGPLYGSKAEGAEASAQGLPAERKKSIKRIYLKGPLTEQDIQVLSNTARHCPVARLFENGLVEFVDEIVLEN